MTPREQWIAATWALVRSWLPEPPARVVEIGCGSLGGFVPMLRADGYDAVGLDRRRPTQRIISESSSSGHGVEHRTHLREM
jgi:hypothetical protein